MIYLRHLPYSVNRAVWKITRNLHKTRQHFSQSKVVLGIETSCDDTGAAVVNTEGQILGEALNSQTKIHVEHGGINPATAKSLHIEEIKNVVTAALQRAGTTLQDLDAIAVTTEPGLAPCLGIGLGYAKELVAESGLPMIPIHHMQAHALTARLIEHIEFPFLVLLISGGHSILTVAQDVDRFLLIGKGLDTSPGDCLEKVARYLNLKSLPQCQNLSGGAAIELMAKGCDPKKFAFSAAHNRVPSCDFSFSGVRTQAETHILKEREQEGILVEKVISKAGDLCASLQYAIAFQICRRLQRAFSYCELQSLLPENSTLVVSGGVASNQYIRQCLQQVCEMNSARLVCPPPKLCTDNGVMIAWNGVEKLTIGRGISSDPQSEDYSPRSPIGKDMTKELNKLGLKIPRLQLEIQP